MAFFALSPDTFGPWQKVMNTGGRFFLEVFDMFTRLLMLEQFAKLNNGQWHDVVFSLEELFPLWKAWLAMSESTSLKYLGE